MQWLVALAIFLAFLLVFPAIVRSMKGRRKGVFGAATLALGMAFSSFLDPAKKAATENIEKKKALGEQDDHGEGQPPSQ